MVNREYVAFCSEETDKVLNHLLKINIPIGDLRTTNVGRLVRAIDSLRQASTELKDLHTELNNRFNK